MPDSTDPTATAADGWCHWHEGPSGTARLIRTTEQTSGPGRQMYACAPCREFHRLPTTEADPSDAAWREHITHLQTCKDCSLDGRCAIGLPLWDAYQAALHAAAAS